MSDFDKEAEREKLREKYEQEQQEREATEQMSELLLQGATMTNAHCSDCGDPIFRYDGQEFCASCEKAVDRDTGEESEDGEAEAGDDDGENIEVATPDNESRVAFGGENAQDDPAAADDQPSQTGQPASAAQSDQSGTEQRQPQQQSPKQRQPDTSATARQPSQQPERTREVPSVDPSGSDDVSAARASLVRTLTRFSEQAEATDDPRQAQEYLAAAREAAETLAALRQ
ncbi:Sjogren's syndrome/scleroderma autoantigen 1 family protein [Salinibaculum rarum]|uniref:Sjogren's syndrome/scleroderma autoantigen 1 family protein n=1 Tax=Salinibaculum rarum TaxID=3058903 RepID=UPI00265F8DAC|nr:Sjogren's syndrome/scleroderma autoantigen 1 family protein [Salinibaculum sp. KK48]